MITDDHHIYKSTYMITFEGSEEELSEHYEHRLHSHNQVQYFSRGGLFERGV